MDLKAFLEIAEQAASNTAPGQAVKGAMKGMGAMTGCSGNALPTNQEEDSYDEVYPKDSKVCYNLNGSQYTVTLLQPMIKGQKSTLAEFENGKRTMIENAWVSDGSPTCDDKIGKYLPKIEEDDEMEDEDD